MKFPSLLPPRLSCPLCRMLQRLDQTLRVKRSCQCTPVQHAPSVPQSHLKPLTRTSLRLQPRQWRLVKPAKAGTRYLQTLVIGHSSQRGAALSPNSLTQEGHAWGHGSCMVKRLGCLPHTGQFELYVVHKLSQGFGSSVAPFKMLT
jgi:hypothetical protein